jgi:hypothetical protein
MRYFSAAIPVLVAALWLASACRPAAADDLQTASWTFPTNVTDVAIPAQFSSDGSIVVRMTVNGRGIDLVLDTGVTDDLIDASVYGWLGLGKSGDECAFLDAARFGALTVRSLRFCTASVYRRDESRHLLVGLLGYDFLRNAVVELDYEHSAVHIIDPAAFSMPKGAARFEQRWGDTRPIVSARVGKALGTSFVVDSGAGATTVFPQFADTNPREFVSKSTARRSLSIHTSDVPRGMSIPKPSVESILFWPLCGRTELDPYSIPYIALGTYSIRDTVVWRVPTASCFRVSGADGLIGYDILHLFDVFIDYPQRLVILKPNSLYKTPGA